MLYAILGTVHREDSPQQKGCNTRMLVVYLLPWDGPKNMIGVAC